MEQNQNTALCLASTTDGTLDPDLARLVKLLPRFHKLLKCNLFNAKPTMLMLIGSVIKVGGASVHTAFFSAFFTSHFCCLSSFFLVFFDTTASKDFVIFCGFLHFCLLLWNSGFAVAAASRSSEGKRCCSTRLCGGFAVASILSQSARLNTSHAVVWLLGMFPAQWPTVLFSFFSPLVRMSL